MLESDVINVQITG